MGSIVYLLDISPLETVWNITGGISVGCEEKWGKLQNCPSYNPWKLLYFCAFTSTYLVFFLFFHLPCNTMYFCGCFCWPTELLLVPPCDAFSAFRQGKNINSMVNLKLGPRSGLSLVLSVGRGNTSKPMLFPKCYEFYLSLTEARKGCVRKVIVWLKSGTRECLGNMFALSDFQNGRLGTITRRPQAVMLSLELCYSVTTVLCLATHCS